MIRNKDIVLGEKYWYADRFEDVSPVPVVPVGKQYSRNGNFKNFLWEIDGAQSQLYLGSIYKSESEAQAVVDVYRKANAEHARLMAEYQENCLKEVELRESAFRGHPIFSTLTDLLGEFEYHLDSLRSYDESACKWELQPELRLILEVSTDEYLRMVGRHPHPLLHGGCNGYPIVANSFVFSPQLGLDDSYHQEIVEFARGLKAVRGQEQ